jgi:hypothetical protein
MHRAVGRFKGRLAKPAPQFLRAVREKHERLGSCEGLCAFFFLGGL